VINILSIPINLLAVLAPLLHAGGTGFWDEILAIIGTIAFIIILIHMFFFDKSEDEPTDERKTRDDNDKNQ